MSGRRLDRNVRVIMLSEYPYNEKDFTRGGVINAVYWLGHGLSALNELDLFVLSPCKHITRKEVRSIGNAKVIYYPPKHRGYDPLLFYSGTRSILNKAIRELKADIVHAQGNADYIFAAVEAEIPHIITVHGIFKNEFNVAKSKFSIKDVVKKIITKRAEQYYSRRIKHLICITKEVEKFVQSASPNVKIYRINNAIDERFFSLLDESKVSAPVVLFVAAITYRKGLHFLMEAFTQIFKDMPHASLRIVGMFDWDAEYVKDLHRKYKEYIDNGSMTFLGAVSREQLYKDFSRCSVFCLPSLAESAPMVISQALAAGKPVVASAVGGLPNMVLHCETGFLVNPGNVEDIYDALKRTLTDEDNRRRMGKKAREFAKEQYSSSSVALKTLEAYYDVIAKTAV